MNKRHNENVELFSIRELCSNRYLTIVDELNTQNKEFRDKQRMTMAKVKNEALKKEITAEIAQMKQGMGCSIEFDHVRKARHRENVFMQDLYDFSMKMIEYAERESSKGNLDELAR